MYNLLSAGFVRLRKSKLFWGLFAAAFLWGATTCFLIEDSIRTYGEIYLITSGGIYLLMPLFYIAPAEAVFCGFFIGTDYSDGTIRNKLFTGHRREHVYLSNFVISCSAGLMFCAAHLLAMVFVGLPLIGTLILTSVSFPLLRIACSVLIVILTSAVFTLLCMLNSNKAAAVTVGMILSFAMIAAGTGVYAKLDQPEFIERAVIYDEWTVVESELVPNPRYVSGTARDVLESAEAILPFSASLKVMEPGDELPPVRVPLCQAGTTAILTAIGIAAFKRKNIK